MKPYIKFFYILYLISFFLFISCQKEKQTHKVKEIDITNLPVRNLFSYKRPIDNCYFVVLETTDECLIGDIDKVLIENDLIFIKDENDNLFLFNMMGKFLNKIGHIGQGGEELLSFVDFYVNTEKRYVGIFDAMKLKVLRYSFDGKYISSHNCPKELSECCNIIGIMGDNLLIGMRNNENSKYTYLTVNEDNYSFRKNYLPYSIIGSVSSTPMRNIASHSKNGFYVTTILSDLIYEFSDKQRLQPILQIKSKQKKINTQILSKINTTELETIFDAEPILRKKGFSVGVSKIYATNKFLNIDYPIPNYQSIDVFYCLNSGEAYRSSTNRSDFFGEYLEPAIATTDTTIVYAIEAERIIELRKNSNLFTNKDVLKTLMNVKEYDNPTLVFFSSGSD